MPYNPATGEGNYLYLPDEGKAYVVMYLDQVGFWTFIDWQWLDYYPDEAIREDVLSYASVQIYDLTPGMTMHDVVTTLLVDQEIPTLEFAAGDPTRVVLEIQTRSEDVVIRNPNGGQFNLFLFEGNPLWNAVHFPELEVMYVIADVFPGEWEFYGEDIFDVTAHGLLPDQLSLTNAELLQLYVDAPVTSQFTVTASDVAEGKVLLAVHNLPASFTLTSSQGVEIPVVFDGPGANAYRDEVDAFVYLLLPVGFLDAGVWEIEASRRLDNIYVVPQLMSQTLAGMLQMIADSPVNYNATVTLGREGAWLVKVRGSGFGISVRNPAMEIVSVPMVSAHEYGEDYTYLRIDVTRATEGRWDVITTAPAGVEIFRIWDADLPLATQAELHKDGMPHNFVVEVNEIGRLLFEIELDVPENQAATFSFNDIRDSIVLIDYNGASVAIEFDENHPDWNAYYVETVVDSVTERRLSLMADAFDAGYWHVHVDYGNVLTVSGITGDPEHSMANIKWVADGNVEFQLDFELDGEGYYLFEIEGGDASTRVYSPGVNADRPAEPVAFILNTDNSRHVGDTLFVLVHTVSGARTQDWRIVSDNEFEFTPSKLDPTNPDSPLTISELLDGEVSYRLDLPEGTRWAVSINDMPAGEVAEARVRRPDASVYAFTFLPAEGFDQVENYPDTNALYDAANQRLMLTVEVGIGEGGRWQLILPKRRPVDLFELEPIPLIETFDVEAVTGEGENVFDIDWRVRNPRAGSVVRIGLLNAAQVAEGNYLSPALVDGLSTRGSSRVQAPQGLVPGDYHFVLYVENPETGVMLEVHPDPVQITYATAPAAPVNLRVDKVGNGEIRVLFDDGQYASVDRYYVFTHLLGDGETAATVPVLNFRGPALDFEPAAATTQSATLVGMETQQTYLITAFAVSVVDPVEEFFQFGLPSNVLEVFLPEPERPDLAFTVSVDPGFHASTLSYEEEVISFAYARDGEGALIVDEETGEYVFDEVSTFITRKATYINSTDADLTVTVQNTPSMPATFEVRLNGDVLATTATAATSETFALTGLSEGVHEVEVLAINSNGDRRTYSEEIIVDVTPPNLMLFSPVNGRITFVQEVLVSGHTEPSADLEIRLNGTALAESSITRDAVTGLFEVTMGSSLLNWNNLYTLEVEVTDEAGNVTLRTLQFYVLEVPADLPQDNADLISLNLSGATLTETFSSTKTSYTGSTSGNEVIFAPASVSPTATTSMSVNGGTFQTFDQQDGFVASLGSGSNNLTLRVTSADGNMTQDYEFIIDAPTQATPTITTWPTASSIAHGLPLSQSTLSGGSASVPGEFFWTNPGTIPPAGSSSQSVTFFPADSVRYANVTGSVNVVALLASQVVITTQPVGGPSGAALATQPVVEIRDAGNRLVTTDSTRTVTVSLHSGMDGTLSGTQTITVSGGVGTFTDLALAGTVGENYTLTFDSAGLNSATSGNITVTPGAPSAATSTISAGVTSLVVHESEGVELSVQLRDAQSNVISTDAATVAVTSTFDFGGASGLGSTTYHSPGEYRATAVSTNTGTATFGATINGSAIADTVSVTYTPAVPASATIDRQPVETVAGLPIHPSPRLIIRDRFGNTVAPGIQVSVSVAQGSGSIVSGESTKTVTTDANGRATFDGIIIDKAEEGYQLKFEVVQP